MIDKEAKKKQKGMGARICALVFVVLVGWSSSPALASTPGSGCDVYRLIFFFFLLWVCILLKLCDLTSLLLLVLVAGFVDGILSNALSALMKWSWTLSARTKTGNWVSDFRG